MHVLIELTGTTPLLHHNIRLANPDDEFTKAIKQITSKRSKTEEDRNEIARLEWFGGLYANEDGPITPAKWVRKSCVGAARRRRMGKRLEGGLIMRAVEFHLDYEGPRDPKALWPMAKFRHQEMVGVQRARTQRTRPHFPLPWSTLVEAELLTDELDYDELADIANAAGLMEGIGDGRSLGFGRFTAVVKKA